MHEALKALRYRFLFDECYSSPDILLSSLLGHVRQSWIFAIAHDMVRLCMQLCYRAVQRCYLCLIAGVGCFVLGRLL